MITRFVYLLLGCVLIVVGGCSEEDKTKQSSAQAQKRPPLAVETVTVKNEKIPVWIEYTGKTEASKRVEVRARVSGRLEKVFFREGEYVEKGQKLFELEKTSYEADLEQAKAKLQGDLASLKLARADVARYVPLVKEGLAPRVTLEQNEARAKELEALIRSDKAKVKDAELNLSYTSVVAPIGGRVGKMDVDLGNIVGYTEKTLLTTIVFDNPMYAYFNPSEEQYQLMLQFRSKQVLDAQVRVPSTVQKILNRKPYTGVVDFRDNRVDRMTSTITMRAAVDNENHDLLEGTFVYVDVFITDERSFLMVPPSVVLEDQLGSFVYVVEGTEKIKRIDIERGYEGRDYLIVDSGLKDGDRVIISGFAKLRPESTIAPKDVTETKGVMAIMKAKEMTKKKENS